MLAQGEDMWVRCDVAKNKNTPIEALALLALDRSYSVRYAVAQNKSTPLEMLKSLSKDKDYCVRREANKNLKEQKTNKKINKER